MKATHILSAFVVAIFLPARIAFAASAYGVDDAGLVDPGKVQIESWGSWDDKGNHLAVIDPAYQLLPNAEFSLLMMHSEQSGDHSNLVAPQVKYQWHPGATPQDISSSIALGFSYAADAQKFSGAYAYIPVSLAVSDTVDVNANLGWQYARDEDRHFATWGIGTELHANDALSFIGEVFGRNEERPGLQFGSRYALSPSLLLDAIYGHNINAERGDWITTGITVAF